MTSVPKISVLMAVHDGQKYLKEAIDSILSQSFADFELIIIDDESEDATPDIIRSYDDPRIIYLRITHGGLVTALNHGFAHARGEYIARMDADDRAIASRFELQVAHLDAHPDIDVLCSDIYTIDATGARSGEQVQHGMDNDMLRDGLLGRRPMKPIIHPSVMMRRRVLEELGGYRHFNYAEDHDLWMRAVDRFSFARLEQFLLEYRVYGGGISRTKGKVRPLLRR
ncbi:glycosyltransferase [Aliirhizobium terrae]|uniref:glycosyltransferase n=1 Tax=Terrirhizobium terrae TaxID=2926709 RepID=UPI002574E351|nr:glycosyltransferase [Rhizobium sp. CC-CFT758]WJH39666.1 glycosyltransferase [Rhizobium sp. CC-CFT758]